RLGCAHTGGSTRCFHFTRKASASAFVITSPPWWLAAAGASVETTSAAGATSNPQPLQRPQSEADGLLNMPVRMQSGNGEDRIVVFAPGKLRQGIGIQESKRLFRR